MPGIFIHAQALAQLLDGVTLPVVGAPVELSIVVLAVLLGVALPFAPLRLHWKAAIAFGVLAAYWAFGFGSFARGRSVVAVAVADRGPVARHRFRRRVRAAPRPGREAAHPRRVRALRIAVDHRASAQGSQQAGARRREARNELRVLRSRRVHDAGREPAARDGARAAAGLPRRHAAHRVRIRRHCRSHRRRRRGGVFRRAAAISPTTRDAPSGARSRGTGTARRFARRSGRKSGVALGVTRIGVHTGTAIVGNVGTAERLHYTAHGDCVNTAARLEGANRYLGTRVCMSREVARHSPELRFVPIGRLVLKGRTQELECVTVGHHLPDEIHTEYLAAYELLDVDRAGERATVRHARSGSAEPRLAGLSLGTAAAW